MSAKENSLAPLQVFNFQVDFYEDPLNSDNASTKNLYLCGGAFSECTGLEATMEPKVIKEGGRNYGAAQRAGPVTFATVVLKRGLTTNKDLWTWFELINREGKYAYRLAAHLTVKNAARRTVMVWKLINAMPLKFKAADLNAKGTDVGIEELHLAHEGLERIQG
ncbi:MAG TPA: phage tail protein [Pyrinomonadaceae bacterium]|jgi:phage tail-like protein